MYILEVTMRKVFLIPFIISFYIGVSMAQVAGDWKTMGRKPGVDLKFDNQTDSSLLVIDLDNVSSVELWWAISGGDTTHTFDSLLVYMTSTSMEHIFYADTFITDSFADDTTWGYSKIIVNADTTLDDTLGQFLNIYSVLSDSASCDTCTIRPPIYFSLRYRTR